MTPMQINRSSLTAGRCLSDMAKSGKPITIAAIKDTLEISLPKGVTPPKVTTSLEAAKDFIRKNTPLSPKEIDKFIANAAAFVVQSFKGKKSLLYVPETFFTGQSTTERGIVAFTHEFRHILDFDKTIKGSTARIIKKLLNLLPSKMQEKLTKNINKLCRTCQQKYLELEILSAKDLSIEPLNGISKARTFWEFINTSREDFRKYISSAIRGVLSESDHKGNLRLLKILKRMIESEAKAYKAGGFAGRKLLDLKPGQKHNSELMAVYQRELLNAIKNQLRIERRKTWRRRFKMTTPLTDTTVLSKPQGLAETSDKRKSEYMDKLFGEDPRLIKALKGEGDCLEIKWE